MQKSIHHNNISIILNSKYSNNSHLISNIYIFSNKNTNPYTKINMLSSIWMKLLDSSSHLAYKIRVDFMNLLHIRLGPQTCKSSNITFLKLIKNKFLNNFVFVFK